MDRDQRQLKEWIVRKRLQGSSISGICAQARVSRDMFYRWWNRYRTEGKPGLEEKPKGRPRSIFVDDPVKIKIVKLRKRALEKHGEQSVSKENIAPVFGKRILSSAATTTG